MVCHAMKNPTEAGFYNSLEILTKVLLAIDKILSH
ncbi:hypothetical protein SAMN04489724_0919 [Algoriphagus locisalis]|uniref:Uncharacterized protein n=1 Tax=Algoriphagus locisalis TaxID=305507 RepID=A0A1I6YC41_9BACT|nr:hypothetical protein SAMN04489724_0919 [Algoriphagus locisalis]